MLAYGAPWRSCDLPLCPQHIEVFPRCTSRLPRGCLALLYLQLTTQVALYHVGSLLFFFGSSARWPVCTPFLFRCSCPSDRTMFGKPQARHYTGSSRPKAPESR